MNVIRPIQTQPLPPSPRSHQGDHHDQNPHTERPTRELWGELPAPSYNSIEIMFLQNTPSAIQRRINPEILDDLRIDLETAIAVNPYLAKEMDVADQLTRRIIQDPDTYLNNEDSLATLYEADTRLKLKIGNHYVRYNEEKLSTQSKAACTAGCLLASGALSIGCLPTLAGQIVKSIAIALEFASLNRLRNQESNATAQFFESMNELGVSFKKAPPVIRDGVYDDFNAFNYE